MRHLSPFAWPRGHLCAELLVGVLSVAALCFGQEPAKAWRFDFGGTESELGEGFTRIAPDAAYSEDQGFGFVQEGRRRLRLKAFDQNRRVIRDTLVLDDVTRDGMYGAATFRVDLPNGTYRVAVLTGQFSRPGANRPDSHFRAYEIKANGVLLYDQEDTVEAFFHPEGRYFHSYYRDWHPDVNLYREIIAPWIPLEQADVQVTGGALEMTTTQYVAANALWVLPAGGARAEDALAEFERGQEASFNERYPYVPSPPEHPLPDLPKTARNGGVVMYVRDNASALRPGTRPVPRDFGRPLRLFASQGEREAGVVAVTPLRDVSGPIDLVASDLSGEGGATIPASAFDIRYLRYGEYPITTGYEVRPFFLVPWRPGRWGKGLTRGFWVDLHTPADAEPGFYDGDLTLTAKDVNAKLPVQVRVLPLRLPRAKLRAGVYAGDLGGTTFRHFRTLRRMPREEICHVLRARMQFLADQGFTGIFDSLPWWPAEWKDGEVMATETWEQWQDIFATAKSIPNFSDRIFCYYVGGPQLFRKCPHWLSRGSIHKMEIDDIRFSEEAIQEMTQMAQWLYEQIRTNDYPELVFYVQDELGNHGAKGARYGRELLKAMNHIRKQVPGGFRTCISALSVAIAREYLDEADIVIPNRAYPVTPETITELRDHGCTLGLYNMGATRFSYGFYPWRVGAILRAQWSFTYDGDRSDPYVALPAGARVSCDCRYTPDWDVLPSIGMLVQREGVDDYRYIQLLEERLASAKAGPAAAEAKRVLDELCGAVNGTYTDPANNWDKSTMDYWRWRVAKAAMGLGGKAQ